MIDPRNPDACFVILDTNGVLYHGVWSWVVARDWARLYENAERAEVARQALLRGCPNAQLVVQPYPEALSKDAYFSACAAERAT